MKHLWGVLALALLSAFLAVPDSAGTFEDELECCTCEGAESVLEARHEADRGQPQQEQQHSALLPRGFYVIIDFGSSTEKFVAGTVAGVCAHSRGADQRCDRDLRIERPPDSAQPRDQVVALRKRLGRFPRLHVVQRVPLSSA